MTLLMSLVGMVTLVAIALIFSYDRKSIRLRTVLGAFAIQAGIGAFVFAIKVLPVIIFFSSLIAVLYYIGIMQWVIRILGGALQKALGTSRTESLSATANIFVGQTEAPLVVRPFAVMCGALASVAGSVLAGYAALGIPMEYLVAASFMAAPGGLLFAKLIMPETQDVSDSDSVSKVEEEIEAQEDKPANVLAFLLGVPWEEATLAGSFIGQKLVVNEFVAYINLAPYIDGEQVVAATGQMMTPHTMAILSFALCGFANLSSIAILLGGLGSIAPTRRKEIARFGVKAVLAGTLSNLMSASIAGFFIALSGASA